MSDSVVITRVEYGYFVDFGEDRMFIATDHKTNKGPLWQAIPRNPNELNGPLFAVLTLFVIRQWEKLPSGSIGHSITITDVDRLHDTLDIVYGDQTLQ